MLDIQETFNALSPEWKMGVYVVAAVVALFALKSLVLKPFRVVRNLKVNKATSYHIVSVTTVCVLTLFLFVNYVMFNVFVCNQFPVPGTDMHGKPRINTETPLIYCSAILFGYTLFIPLVMLVVTYSSKASEYRQVQSYKNRY